MEFISDLHLHAADPATALAWQHYLGAADFDALFILGDLFEVWVGDDLLTAPDEPDAPDNLAENLAERRFLRACANALRGCAQRRPVYVMRGNRDFLLGAAFHHHCGTHDLSDPAVLNWGVQRYLMTHGDAWCLDDHDYMKFRAQVRSAAWQQDFLSRPLAEREAIALNLRRQSEARKAQSRASGLPLTESYADVNRTTAQDGLTRVNASLLIHGHTHRPAEHDLGQGRQRLVLSDWDLNAQPPRAQALRLHANGQWTRRDLGPTPAA